jgi:hypothetical protein
MYRPQVRIAVITAHKDLQADPADVFPTSALNVVAAIYLLNCVSTYWAVSNMLFSLAPFLQGHVRILLELLVFFT